MREERQKLKADASFSYRIGKYKILNLDGCLAEGAIG
jgi:hypothetical protein